MQKRIAPQDGICPRCGNAAGSARFCSECGLRLRPDERQAAARSVEALEAPLADRGGPRRRRRAPPDPDVVWSVGLLPSPRANGGGDSASVVRRARAEDWQLDRRVLMQRMLELARSEESLEHARLPGELGAMFLRRYDTRHTTQEAYARDLADWFVWLAKAGIDPFEATLASVESYSREALSSGRAPAPATMARRLACLSGFYRRCQWAGAVLHNPAAEAHRPRVPEHVDTLGLSKDRAQALIRAARRAGPRETLLVLMMLELGLRVSEAVGADIEDLGEQGRFKVLAIRGKGQVTKAARVPLNPALLDAIARATAERERGPLIATATGRRLTRQHAGQIIRALGEQIGVPRLHPHELRHAFVTLALDAGEPLRDVQDAARHADPRTTRRYDSNRHSLERHPTHRLLSLLEPVRPVNSRWK